MTTLILYHGNCTDGFCSAWMAWKMFGDSVHYQAVHHGRPPPEGLEGKRVYLLDFCYGQEDMLNMIECVDSLTVLDHRVSAAKDMAKLAERTYPKHVQFVFDMERSGAGLARDHFQPGMSYWLVDYIQDRDLWKFVLPMSEEVNAYIHTLLFTFEEFEMVEKTVSPENAAIIGSGALRYKHRYVEAMVNNAMKVTFAGYKDIPLVNVTRMGASEILNKLAVRAKFAVGWHQRGDGLIEFSLRSVGDFNVSELAQKYGGGGHAKAAGFTQNFPIHHYLSPIR
jgi:uncharacterized protein